MIRYTVLPDGKPINIQNLEAAIRFDAQNHSNPDIRARLKDWLGKAKARTNQLVAAGSYIDSKKWNGLTADKKMEIEKPINVDWSDIKYLFMEIQHQKCAYCERKFAAHSDGGSAEHDLEHFRTKNPVKAWPAPKDLKFAVGPGHEGYYWLAYNLLNYCTACKKCNSGFKSNYFPTAGPTPSAPELPSKDMQSSELPYLAYPLGTIDQDPEEILRFIGLNAFPPADDPLATRRSKKDVHLNQRAKIIIKFFELNGREELLWGRAERLRELEKSLADLNSPDQELSNAAKSDIQRLYSGVSEHTACIRGMLRLYESNLDEARRHFLEVRKYLDSKTPKNFKVSQGALKSTSPASPV